MDQDIWSSAWPLYTPPLSHYGVASHDDVVIPPTDEPLLLQDAIDHVRALNTNEDGYLTHLIAVVRRWMEYKTQRALMPQTHEIVMDRFPRRAAGVIGGWHSGMIRVTSPPCLSIVSITYLDTTGMLQTLDPTTYDVDIPIGPRAGYARIRPLPRQHWPETQRGKMDAVRVRFTCGYFIASSPPTSPPDIAVPEDLRHAMLMILAELYKQRSDSMPTGNTPAVLRSRDLWSSYRVY